MFAGASSCLSQAANNDRARSAVIAGDVSTVRLRRTCSDTDNALRSLERPHRDPGPEHWQALETLGEPDHSSRCSGELARRAKLYILNAQLGGVLVKIRQRGLSRMALVRGAGTGRRRALGRGRRPPSS